MQKVLFFLLMLFLIIPLTTYSQSHNTEDVIYLLDGGIWRGEIIETDSTQLQTVKIKITGGSVIVVNTETIEKITHDKKLVNDFYLNTTHFYNFTTVGFLIGDDTFSGTPVSPSFATANGYRWNSGLLTGAEVCIEYIDVNLLQIAADIRYDFTKDKLTPYVYANGGFNIPLAQDVSNDFYSVEYSSGGTVGAGIGMRIRSNKSLICFIWSFGYKVSTFSKTEIYYNDTKYVSNYTLPKLILRIGFAF